MTSVILLGYSGHAFVVCDIFASRATRIAGYCEAKEKAFNPYQLKYLGPENTAVDLLKTHDYFIAIGSNSIRKKVYQFLERQSEKAPISAIHQLASVSSTAELGAGTMVGNGSIINACCKIGVGVICNTQSVIEHESTIGAFSHIAPGAVLCGNVSIGESSFVGARAVIKPGITVGNQVTIGAGAVVIKDIPDHTTVVGNPQRQIP